LLSYALLNSIAIGATGLYHRRQRNRFIGVLVRVGVAIAAAGSAAVGLLSYLLPDAAVPRSVLLTAGVFAGIVIGFARFVFEHVVDEERFKNRVLVLGAGNRAMSSGASAPSFRPARLSGVHGYVPDVRRCRGGFPPKTCWKPRRTCWRTAASTTSTKWWSAWTTAAPLSPWVICWIAVLAGCGSHRTHRFPGTGNGGRVRLDVVNPSWMIFSGGFAHHPVQLAVKRALDIGASLLLLAFALAHLVAGHGGHQAGSTACAPRCSTARRAWAWTANPSTS
jgi:hypothetical protein